MFYFIFLSIHIRFLSLSCHLKFSGYYCYTLHLLRNDCLPEHTLPYTYAFELHDRAMLYARMYPLM
ncbi:hypothetical protein C8R48DRAFT_722528 [Suillus tomentosus]|nr:hypothetical protein C8R48DRAFT_722528 [Suillus tomentosus]